MRLSPTRLGPPKAPRNVFFPWFNFTLVKQEDRYLHPRQVTFHVPVHMTKPEIREYLRRIYGMKVIAVNTAIKVPIKRRMGKAFIREAPIHKIAFVQCEETIPDEVKMATSSKDPAKNPFILKDDMEANKEHKKKREWFRPGVGDIKNNYC